MKIPHFCILVSPKGEEFFAAYGPPTKDRAEATRYVSRDIADGAAAANFGTDDRAFWNCEREAAQRARANYRGWTHRVEACEKLHVS